MAHRNARLTVFGRRLLVERASGMSGLPKWRGAERCSAGARPAAPAAVASGWSDLSTSGGAKSRGGRGRWE
ncbi:hypothetical protein GCM10010299_37290 [Streptomyces tanashiensis]|nr:hypothetical protein GCM10010299_37290 [Streptomyces tanashiensis]